MSGVDVLAAMDKCIAALDGWSAAPSAAPSLREARAAVAELIEAAGTVVEAHTNPSARNRLRAAHARCRGGSA